jgi:hypothetical protein
VLGFAARFWSTPMETSSEARRRADIFSSMLDTLLAKPAARIEGVLRNAPHDIHVEGV